MDKLEQAEVLFKQPLTIESLRKLDTLERQARGQEADYIGELWEAVFAAADENVLTQARKEGLI
ncbi:hypothetical protein [Photobacterium minamisatsumaniensis]|uniref:hypothetical protein n=1 Tax=Photobacterium minamisatsumaniensis TaxID=2910233 RepID=UPI003D0C91AC